MTHSDYINLFTLLCAVVAAILFGLWARYASSTAIDTENEAAVNARKKWLFRFAVAIAVIAALSSMLDVSVDYGYYGKPPSEPKALEG